MPYLYNPIIFIDDMRRLIVRASRKIVYFYQDILSTIGFRIFGIDFICRKLESSDSYFTDRFLRKYGSELGQHVNFKGGIIIDNASKDKDSTNDFRNLIIRDNCYIGKKVFFDLPNQILLEEEVVLGAGVSIFTHADCGRRFMSQYYPRETGPVVIGRGTWIGANATILCNVKIGEKCVVAAGSVVTRSFGPNEIVGGVPAKKIGEIL